MCRSGVVASHHHKASAAVGHAFKFCVGGCGMRVLLPDDAIGGTENRAVRGGGNEATAAPCDALNVIRRGRCARGPVDGVGRSDHGAVASSGHVESGGVGDGVQVARGAGTAHRPRQRIRRSQHRAIVAHSDKLLVRVDNSV